MFPKESTQYSFQCPGVFVCLQPCTHFPHLLSILILFGRFVCIPAPILSSFELSQKKVDEKKRNWNSQFNIYVLFYI